MNQRGRKRGHCPTLRSQGQSWPPSAGCVSQDSLLACSEPHCPHLHGGHTLCKMVGVGTERGQVGRCLAMGLCVWPAGLPLTPASLCGFPYSSTPFVGWGTPTSPRGWPQLDLPLVLGAPGSTAHVSGLGEITEPLCPLSLPWAARCMVQLQDSRGAPNTDATGAGEDGHAHYISSSLVKQSPFMAAEHGSIETAPC